MNIDPLEPLREALAVSPDNGPLRRHYAGLLFAAGRAEEAEVEFRRVLMDAPDDLEAKLGLARIYLGQGKLGTALVLAEDVAAQERAPAGAHVVLAWALARSGQLKEAGAAYREALERAPDTRDVELEAVLAGGEVGKKSEATQTGMSVPQLAGLAAGTGATAWIDKAPPAKAQSDPFGALSVRERPRITFSDVGGMEAVKDDVRVKIILPYTNHDLYAAYGKKAGGGILLYGPPGCGKTLLARATAGEVNADFLSVGLHDILDMWVGSSEKRLHELFEQARERRPCVLFFDEVDALAASRTDMRHSASRHLINQFLFELDGVDTDNQDVLVLAATNAPWHLDAAFRRPGRFDRELFVPPPDQEARARIVDLLLQGKPVEKVDSHQVAKRTDGYSGADLKGMMDLVVEGKLKEAMKLGKPQPIRTADLLAAAKAQRPSTKEWFASARNYALYANEAGVYDDVLQYLKLKP